MKRDGMLGPVQYHFPSFCFYVTVKLPQWSTGLLNAHQVTKEDIFYKKRIIRKELRINVIGFWGGSIYGIKKNDLTLKYTGQCLGFNYHSMSLSVSDLDFMSI